VFAAQSRTGQFSHPPRSRPQKADSGTPEAYLAASSALLAGAAVTTFCLMYLALTGRATRKTGLARFGGDRAIAAVYLQGVAPLFAQPEWGGRDRNLREKNRDNLVLCWRK